MQSEILEQKGVALSEQLKKTYGFSYLQNAIQKVPARISDESGLKDFQLDTERLISAFPSSDFSDKSSRKEFSKLLSAYKLMLLKKYKMVSKGYYLTIWMPLGIAIGMPWGLLFKNIALGLPLGIGIGLAIGGGLDRKAEKEDRVL